MHPFRSIALIVTVLLAMALPVTARASAIDTNPPGPPGHVHATARDGAMTVSWTPGAHAVDSPISGFIVSAYIGAEMKPVVVAKVDGTACATRAGVVVCSTAIKGVLKAAPYVFTLRAVSSGGTSAESDASNSASWIPGRTTPDPPQYVIGRSGVRSISLSWPAPYDGGNPIAGYEIAVYSAGSGNLLRWIPVAAGTTSASVSDLAAGTAYFFTIAARNAIGWSAESGPSEAVATVAARPDAPAGVRAGVYGDDVLVSWKAPYDGGSPVTNYIINAFYDGASTPVRTVSAGFKTESIEIRNLALGHAYVFTVVAVNEVGVSDPSARSNRAVLRATAPDAPTNVHAVAGAGYVTLTWTAPAFDGGSPIVSYVVTAYAGSTVPAATMTIGAGATAATFTTLADGGTYIFAVASVNAIGQSAPSALAGPITLATVPGPPRDVAATAGDASATVRWNAPASDGGSAITGYQVTVSDGTHDPMVVVVSGTHVTVGDLTNNTVYSVSVGAINALGRGGSASVSVTPKNDPPVLTVPSAQSVRYGASLDLSVSARDTESADHLTLRASGLPEGLAFHDRGDGSGAFTGAVLAVPGTYTVVFSADDGHNPAVTQLMSITVTRAALSIRAVDSSPKVLKISRSKNSGAFTLRANISDALGNGHGNLANAAPVTYSLSRIGGGSGKTCAASLSATGSDTVVASCSFSNLPVGAYRIRVTTGGPYYEGAGDSMLTVYDPAQHISVKGSGTLVHGTASAAFSLGFTRTGKKGRPGSFVLIDHRSSGTVTVASTGIDAIAVRGGTAYIQGRATVNGAGTYRFIATATSTARGSLGLWITDGAASVDDLSFPPTTLSSGRTLVRHI